MALPTPPSLPSARVCLTLEVPDSALWRQAVVGALLQLTYRRTWEEVGVTVDEAAALMLECFQTHQIGGCMFAGIVTAYAGGTPPTGWLICDGTAYDPADYPRLFAAIGYTWGGSGSSFNVPDLRYRVPVGVGSFSGQPSIALGGTGGEPEHQLTIAEMPNHDHDLPFDAAVAVTPGELPVVVPAVLGLYSTHETGGDEPHNNMQPYAGLHWIIST